MSTTKRKREKQRRKANPRVRRCRMVSWSWWIHLGAFEAVHRAGVRRFRPIILTTLTTCGGLAPMIFETSRQARFMIPMAISLGFGIVFATAIILVIVPCLYLMQQDLTGERGPVGAP